MKVHVFRCKCQGWNNKYVVVCIDAEKFTENEARAQFIAKTGFTEKSNGQDYPFTYYEYEGNKYYKVGYWGVYDSDNLPDLNY
ncbi:hypothetical protein EI71_00713 [Anaeroplasma bactoclasticum]|jgi:hypothetical protein|uniref:Uncharacterized protein n=1 Tax=Anaeroplasma bactoclasticum TaxID=2088 RepID=A0A397RUC8_9MOLU|nr:hypothetical protein [Anaeroplasma bactoclasticum]RIA77930.1 hypothetical protein EI71_00713 [Anaeroplasma bactoclasticum]